MTLSKRQKLLNAASFLLFLITLPVSSQAISLTVKNETKDIYIKDLVVKALKITVCDYYCNLISKRNYGRPYGSSDVSIHPKTLTFRDTVGPGESKEISISSDDTSPKPDDTSHKHDLAQEHREKTFLELSPNPDHTSSIDLKAWRQLSTRVHSSTLHAHISVPHHQMFTEARYDFPYIGNLLIKMEGAGGRQEAPSVMFYTHYVLTISHGK